jgi:hypothetical protein
MKKTISIFLNAFPIFIMIGMVPLIKNDYMLTLIYIVITIIALIIRKEKNDLIIFTFGFVIMIVCEYLFISTGVETFKRNSLFGLMPLWLPFLWGYGFVVIKRGIEILDS